MENRVGKSGELRTSAHAVLGLVMIIALVLPAGGVAAGNMSAGHTIVPAASDAVVAGVAGATDDWWAAAQDHILADMKAGPQGLPDAADWDPTGEGTNDSFGLSVAGAGDVDGDGYADVIVGAPNYSGADNKGKAYLFYGSETGLASTPLWAQVGDQSQVYFGYSVAGAGDVNGDGYADVVVGAYNDDDGQGNNVGRAFVFLGGDDGLDLSPLTPFQGESSGDSFGYSVAGAGDVNGDGYADVVVGARGYSGDTGRVYVYHGGASGPDQFADRTLTGEAASDWFGHSVAGVGDIDGDGFDEIAIGAVGHDVPASHVGAAYVYRGSSSGVAEAWGWKQAFGDIGDWFGYSVAGAGDVDGDGYADVLVGAKYFGGGSAKFGAAYLYLGDKGGLNENFVWYDTGENDGDYYGTSVAGAGDVNGDGYADIIVGAADYGANKGKVYAYMGGPDGPDTDPAWMPEGESNSDDYGAFVAGAGDVNGDGFADVLVGAPGRSTNKGKAYAYYGSADIPSLTEDWDEEGVTSGDQFGWRVASAGDVNGDGYADVLVGAWGVATQKGRVYAYHGSQDGLSPDFSDWDADGEKVSSYFGWSLAAAGDVNGDGYGDVIIGAYGYKNSEDETVGKAYVYHGGPDGLADDPVWSLSGENQSDYYGRSVASAGDVNGDGYADVLVGADGHSNYKGKVYCYHGSAGGLNQMANQSYTGAANYDHFGYSVAGAGDTNGDGYGDVVVGAYGAPNTGNGKYRGSVYLYAGTASGLGPISVWTRQGEGEDDHFGWSVAGAGDVDGDGYHDVLVGAWKYQTGRGKAYLYNSVNGTLGSVAAWVVPGPALTDGFAYSVAGAGDVNGDGLADWLIGAWNPSVSAQKGYSALFLGPVPEPPPEGPPAVTYPPYKWSILGEASGDAYGISVAGAGDVDGDGYSDLLVGAPAAGGGGKAYAYYGNDGGGRLVRPRQMDSDDTLLQPWTLTTSPGGFEVWMWAWNPVGHGRVKLEVGACPAGKNWSGEGCRRVRSSDWVDTFESGGKAGRVLVKVQVDALTDASLYHWRARVLYAPYSVARPAVSPPPNPAHGPWRRFLGQAFDADLRTQPCTYDISVSPSTAALTGGPGSTVRYRLRLVNDGNCQNVVYGTVSGNTWTTNVPSAIGPLAPGEEHKFEARVQIPGGTAEGATDTATVTLTSREDPAQAVDSVLTTTVGSFKVYLPMVVRSP